MREFSRLSTTIWNSQKFKRVGDDGRLIYFYLHTCQAVNSVGCFVLKDGSALEDLNPDEARPTWTLERYRKAIDSLCIADLIAIDRREKLVRIVDFLKFSPFTNKKHATGALKIASFLPNCHQKLLLFKDIAAQTWLPENAQIDSTIDSLSIAYRNPIDTTETETETETETTEGKPSAAAVAAAPKDDFSASVFDTAITFLTGKGVAESRARSFVGKMRKAHKDTQIVDAIAACSKAGAVDPIPWITARLEKLNPPKVTDDEIADREAKAIKAGNIFLVRMLSPSRVRDLIKAGRVTEEQCRDIGLQF